MTEASGILEKRSVSSNSLLKVKIRWRRVWPTGVSEIKASAWGLSVFPIWPDRAASSGTVLVLQALISERCHVRYRQFDVGFAIKYHRDGHVQVEVGSHLFLYKQGHLIACKSHHVSLLQPARHLKTCRRRYPQEARPL